MPSTGQPWMLQRAKWEREKKQAISDARETTTSKGSLRCWLTSQPASDFYDYVGMKGDRDGGIVVQMGALSDASGEVSVVARHYKPSADLHCVFFLDGDHSQSKDS